ncbi:uncharacterized protein LOC116254594 isoform X1 [Nymphaea colorata]|nr:uncharacterized protein LOC116254594 isoform X1 [Nymphaea colorata]
MTLLLSLPLKFSLLHFNRTDCPKLPSAFFSTSTSSSSSSSLPSSCLRLRPRSSKNDSGDSSETGDKPPTDWDRAWASFKKQGKKKGMFSQFSPNKYVTWNPRRSDYPVSEEVDPIKRTERSNLMLWTSPKFTLIPKEEEGALLGLEANESNCSGEKMSTW